MVLLYCLTATESPRIYTLSLHDALPISIAPGIFATPMMAGMTQEVRDGLEALMPHPARLGDPQEYARSEEHTSELQSRGHLVCRLLLERKNNEKNMYALGPCELVTRDAL